MNFLKNQITKCRRDRKATEAAIVEAASKLFAEKGYDGTRTLEIAKEAGANEALITRYFGGKEGLLKAVLLDRIQQNSFLCREDQEKFDSVAPNDGKTSLSEALRTFFKHGKELTKEKEHLMRIAVSRSLVDPEIAQVVRTRILDQQLPLMEKNLKTYVTSSKITKNEIQAAALLISNTNFSLNFLCRIVHQMDDKSVDLSLNILAKAIEDHFSQK
jgi:AcrR family transcriptional regulator